VRKPVFLPSVAVVEHSGRYSQKKRDGTQTIVVLSPRPAVVQAARAAGQYTGSVGGSFEKMPFWGRGIAAKWHLYIESAEVTLSGVDLSALTEIDIAIGYDAFLQSCNSRSLDPGEAMIARLRVLARSV
jgi:hypothetical protein